MNSPPHAARLLNVLLGHRILLVVSAVVLALHAGLWSWAWSRQETRPVLAGTRDSQAVTTRSLPMPSIGVEPVAPAPIRSSAKARSETIAVAAVEGQVPNTLASPAQAPTESVPLYATRFAPPSLLSYELRRGEALGTASLSWQPSDQTYEARLDRALPGRPLQSWVSQGGFDAAGLAPLRQTDERRGRAQRATNFQREAGKLSFSSSAAELPLPPGVQDRLSWMLQLGAIIEADPQAFPPGQTVQLPVAFGQGRMDIWHFAVQAREALELPAGQVDSALRVERLTEALYEPRIEVWLDPQRNHLPVRMRWSRSTGDPGLELNLLKEPQNP